MKKKATKKRSKPMSEKQKKALAKGQNIQKLAMKIMREGGKKTIPAKQVYKITLRQAMKKAAGKNIYNT